MHVLFFLLTPFSYFNRAEVNKKNYLAEIEEKKVMWQEKVHAETAKWKAQLLASRCKVKDDNVMQLKKQLVVANEKIVELGAALKRERKRHVKCKCPKLVVTPHNVF